MILPAAGVTAGLPGALLDPAGPAPGGRSGGAGYRPPRRPAGSVWAEPARLSLIAGMLASAGDGLRASQIRGMTGIR